jgi:hypothetical protein
MKQQITINPCGSCRKHKKGRVNVMSCCYETCKDWLGEGQNIEGSECYKNCKQCLDTFIAEDGKTECTYYTGIPAVFNQVPAFLPDLYSQTNDISKSLELCKLKCNKTPYPNTCIEKCDIDADSIVVKNSDENSTSFQPQQQTSIHTTVNKPIVSDNLFILVIFILFIFIITQILRTHQ